MGAHMLSSHHERWALHTRIRDPSSSQAVNIGLGVLNSTRIPQESRQSRVPDARIRPKHATWQADQTIVRIV
jgi:hypothetical protein